MSGKEDLLATVQAITPDAMKAQARDEPIRAVKFSGVRYDVGAKIDYLRAQVEIAAQRDDLGTEFRQFLHDFVKEMD